jgi:hypothetical protein
MFITVRVIDDMIKAIFKCELKIEFVRKEKPNDYIMCNWGF